MTPNWKNIKQFCAEEVARQYGTTDEAFVEKPTAWMIAAWSFAIEEFESGSLLSSDLITRFGYFIEPNKNYGGFRCCPVMVGIAKPPDWRHVHRLMSQLFTLDNLNEMTPEEIYLEFEKIHPFRDGNGRTGKIIYNWCLNSLDDPQMPPNFFGCSNP